VTSKNITHNELSHIVKEEITSLTIAYPEPKILTLSDVLMERKYPNDANRPNKVLFASDDVKVVVRQKGELTLGYALGEIDKIHKAEDPIDDRIDITLQDGGKLYKVLPDFVFLSTQAPAIEEIIFGPDAEGLEPRAGPTIFGGVSKEGLTTRAAVGKALAAAFEETEFITWLKLELSKWVLSELGIVRNQGFLGRAIPAFFANIRWSQIDNYIKRDTGPELIADAFVDSLSLMASQKIFKESLQDILGLSPQEDTISDAFFSYINVNLSTSISEGLIGRVIKAKVADALRTVSLRVLLNIFFEKSTLDKASMAWVMLRAWLEHYLKEKLDWEGVDLSVLDIDTTLFETATVNREIMLLEESQVRSMETYSLSRSDLRQIIVEEISIIDSRNTQTRQQINEIAWVPLILKGIAATSFGAAAIVYYRKEILQAIDETAIGEFIKNEIAGSILSILGAEKDKGLVGKTVPIVIQNIQLHKLENYLSDDQGAEELSKLIVGSMARVVVEESFNYALLLFGVDPNKRSKIGNKILKFISTLISRSFKEDSRLYKVMVSELTKAIKGVDVAPVIEKAKEEKPEWKKFLIDLSVEYLGLDPDEEG
jgi:hypothetical protein